MARKRRTRRGILRLGGVAFAGITGCSAPGTNPNTVNFADDFESGFTGWDTGTDLPDDPNNPGNAVDWRISHSTARAASGAASLQYYLDGRQDDGTIWIVRAVPVDGGTAYEVSMRTGAWSASESFNTLAHLVMYAGQSQPTAESSFPEPGSNTTGAGTTRTGGLREPLNQVEGWRTYTFSWTTEPFDSATLYIAVGISAVWETEMTYFVDDVTVSATPQ